MVKTFEQKLCEILVARKAISQLDSEALQRDFSNRSKESFTEFLLHEEIVEKNNLLAALSEYYQVPAFDVSGQFFKRELITKFPQEFLLQEGVIPFEQDEDILVIVASEPDNENLIPDLSEYVSDEIQFYVGLKDDIVDVINNYYDMPSFVEQEDEDLKEVEDEEDVYAGSQIFDDPYRDEDKD